MNLEVPNAGVSKLDGGVAKSVDSWIERGFWDYIISEFKNADVLSPNSNHVLLNLFQHLKYY